MNAIPGAITVCIVCIIPAILLLRGKGWLWGPYVDKFGKVRKNYGPKGFRGGCGAALLALAILISCGTIGSIQIATAPSSLPTKPASISLRPNCQFAYGEVDSCASKNPTVGLSTVWHSDAHACTATIDWGDKTKILHLQTQGHEQGKSLLTHHTYTNTGRYTINMTVKSKSGSCSMPNGRYQFVFEK